MKKCECIGCNNIGSNQVKENETGNMVNVCDEHVATINQVSTMSSIFEDKNTSIELFDKRQNISYFYCLPNNFYTFAIIKSYLNAIQGRT